MGIKLYINDNGEPIPLGEVERIELESSDGEVTVLDDDKEWPAVVEDTEWPNVIDE